MNNAFFLLARTVTCLQRVVKCSNERMTNEWPALWTYVERLPSVSVAYE